MSDSGWWKSFPGRGNGMYKASEERKSLENSLVGDNERIVENGAGEVGRGQSCWTFEVILGIWVITKK